MKRVVVIGGGFAGTCVAQQLQRYFSVTLIDSKSYFEFTPGILRTIVEPKHWESIRVLHRQYLRHARIIVGVVTSVSAGEVCAGRQKIPFDYLAICSGSSYNSPIKEQQVVLPMRARHLTQAHERLEKAKKVLIIGGGLVGVELAAEIATHYRGERKKDVTLVHAHSFLMERNLMKSRLYAARFLKQSGVQIIYGDRVLRHEGRAFVSEQGRRLHSDIAFLCTGIEPNFSFLDDGLKQALNEQGYIKVNEYLQVSGFQNIFAAGDITNTAVEKTAQNAEKQASVVAANIHALETEKALRTYAAKKTPQVISLGRWDGMFEISGQVIKGTLPAVLKQVIERRELWRRGGF